MLNKSTYLKIMALVETEFGPQDMAKHDLHHNLLIDTEPDDLKIAAMRCINELRQYPNIKDIKDRLPSTAVMETIAARAWMRLVEECSFGPSDYNPATGSTPNMKNCDPRELEILREIGGVSRMTAALADQTSLNYMRREFLQHIKEDHNAAQKLRDIRNEYYALHPVQECKQLTTQEQIEHKEADPDAPHVHMYTPEQEAFRAAAAREYVIGPDGMPVKRTTPEVKPTQNTSKDGDTLDTQDW